MQYENVIFINTSGFHCKGCGACCRDQPPDINFKEQQRIQKAGYKNFMQDPSNPNNRNMRQKKDGSCLFITKENTCKINSIKPSICHMEPFIITDFDYSTNTIYIDLNPQATNNCKGISTGENVAMIEIGKAAQGVIKDFQEIIAEKTGLAVTDKKVAALTRKLILDLK
jgi:Fe-S-cluster containining protein